MGDLQLLPEVVPMPVAIRAHNILQGLRIGKKDHGYRAPALGELYRASFQTGRLKEEHVPQ